MEVFKMTPKRPNWSKCFQKGIIEKCSNAKPLNPGSPVQVGMSVSAIYGESIVFLKITEALQNNDFQAKIEFFEPVNIAPPEDLKEGEIVLIDREHICWLHPNDK
jgi:hypothetical protein